MRRPGAPDSFPVKQQHVKQENSGRHLEAVNKQVVQSQQSHSILNLEAQHEGLHEVCALLQGPYVLCVLSFIPEGGASYHHMSIRSYSDWDGDQDPLTSLVFNSTLRFFGLYRICRSRCSTTGCMRCAHCCRRGVSRCGGTRTFRYSLSPPAISWAESAGKEGMWAYTDNASFKISVRGRRMGGLSLTVGLP